MGATPPVAFQRGRAGGSTVPLDVWNPESDAERIRRRLDAGDDVPLEISELRRVPLHLPSGDVDISVTIADAGPHRRRRFVSLLLAALVVIPIILLLPAVARAPAMQPARAWSTHALERTQAAWTNIKVRAHQLWMKEADGNPPPGPKP